MAAATAAETAAGATVMAAAATVVAGVCRHGLGMVADQREPVCRET